MSNRRTRRPYTDTPARAAAAVREGDTSPKKTMLLAAALLLVFVGGCDRALDKRQLSDGTTSMSEDEQQASAARPASSHPRRQVAKQAQRLGLKELLARVPSAKPPTSNPAGGTLIGSDTGEPGSVEPMLAAAPINKPKLTAGEPVLVPLLSSPAIEQAARAQIYWSLHKACPGPDGHLPAEVIKLEFTIRANGSVEPASVRASAQDAKYAAVAECVLRTFSSLPFHGPIASRGATTPVVVTWPSVD